MESVNIGVMITGGLLPRDMDIYMHVYQVCRDTGAMPKVGEAPIGAPISVSGENMYVRLYVRTQRSDHRVVVTL